MPILNVNKLTCCVAEPEAESPVGPVGVGGDPREAIVRQRQREQEQQVQQVRGGQRCQVDVGRAAHSPPRQDDRRYYVTQHPHQNLKPQIKFFLNELILDRQPLRKFLNCCS